MLCGWKVEKCAYIHPFYGPLDFVRDYPGDTRTNLDFTEARGSEWQWHQLGHM